MQEHQSYGNSRSSTFPIVLQTLIAGLVIFSSIHRSATSLYINNVSSLHNSRLLFDDTFLFCVLTALLILLWPSRHTRIPGLQVTNASKAVLILYTLYCGISALLVWRSMQHPLIVDARIPYQTPIFAILALPGVLIYVLLARRSLEAKTPTKASPVLLIWKLVLLLTLATLAIARPIGNIPSFVLVFAVAYLAGAIRGNIVSWIRAFVFGGLWIPVLGAALSIRDTILGDKTNWYWVIEVPGKQPLQFLRVGDHELFLGAPHTSAILVTLFILSLSLAAIGKNKRLAGLAATIYLLGIAMTLSRGAVIGLVFATLTFVVTRWNTLGKRQRLGFLGAVPAIIVLVPAISVLRGYDLSFRGISPLRARVMQLACEHIAKSPLLGCGVGGIWRECKAALKIHEIQAWNIFLHVFWEQGIVGLTLLLILSVMGVMGYLRRVRVVPNKQHQTIYMGLGLAAIALLGHCMVDVLIRVQQMAIFWLVIVGVTLGCLSKDVVSDSSTAVEFDGKKTAKGIMQALMLIGSFVLLTFVSYQICNRWSPVCADRLSDVLAVPNFAVMDWSNDVDLNTRLEYMVGGQYGSVCCAITSNKPGPVHVTLQPRGYNGVLTKTGHCVFAKVLAGNYTAEWRDNGRLIGTCPIVCKAMEVTLLCATASQDSKSLKFSSDFGEWMLGQPITVKNVNEYGAATTNSWRCWKSEWGVPPDCYIVTYSDQETPSIVMGRSDTMRFNGGVLRAFEVTPGTPYKISGAVVFCSSAIDTWCEVGWGNAGAGGSPEAESTVYRKMERYGQLNPIRFTLEANPTGSELIVYLKFGHYVEPTAGSACMKVSDLRVKTSD